MSEQTINGWQLDLDRERHVFVAERDEDFLIEFKNDEGHLTRLRLSFDAADALRYLLGRHIPADEAVMKFMVNMTQTHRSLGASTLQWVEIKRDTAPTLVSQPET